MNGIITNRFFQIAGKQTLIKIQDGFPGKISLLMFIIKPEIAQADVAQLACHKRTV